MLDASHGATSRTLARMCTMVSHLLIPWIGRWRWDGRQPHQVATFLRMISSVLASTPSTLSLTHSCRDKHNGDEYGYSQQKMLCLCAQSSFMADWWWLPVTGDDRAMKMVFARFERAHSMSMAAIMKICLLTRLGRCFRRTTSQLQH